MYTDIDLWETLSDEARREPKTPLAILPTTIEKVAQSWMFKDRLPLVTVTRDYEENSATITQVRT